MKIYLDAVWALNFIFDFMLLLLTRSIARDPTSQRRLLFGAFIASLAVPISLYFPRFIFNHFFGKIIYSIIIIFCAFRFLNIYQFFKRLFIFYFVSFAIGGGLIAFYFILQHPFTISSQGILTFHEGFGDPVSWLFVLIGFPIVYFFTKRRMDKHGIDKIRMQQLCPVSVTISGKTFSTAGYIDSGNQLVDPLTQFPVLIGDESFLQQWFTVEDWQALEKAQENLDLQDLPENWQSSLHMIPYQGVEGKHEFLIAIRPEKVIVLYEEEKYETDQVLIGIQFGQLAKDGLYHCLLQPQIFNVAQIKSA